MEEITFSFRSWSDIYNHIPALLQQFEQEQEVRVRLETIPWAMGWARMVEVHYLPS